MKVGCRPPTLPSLRILTSIKPYQDDKIAAIRSPATTVQGDIPYSQISVFFVHYSN